MKFLRVHEHSYEQILWFSKIPVYLVYNSILLIQLNIKLRHPLFNLIYTLIYLNIII